MRSASFAGFGFFDSGSGGYVGGPGNLINEIRYSSHSNRKAYRGSNEPPYKMRLQPLDFRPNKIFRCETLIKYFLVFHRTGVDSFEILPST